MEFKKNIDEYRNRKAPRGIHSPLHEFIDETRNEWNDKFSFGVWLGLVKNVPLSILYMIRGDIRDSNAKSPAKLFFWKVREWKRAKSEKVDK